MAVNRALHLQRNIGVYIAPQAYREWYRVDRAPRKLCTFSRVSAHRFGDDQCLSHCRI